MLRKCCMRAMAVGDEGCVAKVLAQGKDLLESRFIPRLGKRARQLFPEVKSGDSVMVLTDQRRRPSLLMAVPAPSRIDCSQRCCRGPLVPGADH